MKAFKLNFRFKLLLLFILPLFIFFSLFSVKSALATCDPSTCNKINNQCAGTGSDGHCEAFKQRCVGSGASATCQSLANGAGSGCGECRIACQLVDCPGCTSTCTGFKFSCTCGGAPAPGGGGEPAPVDTGDTPPKGVYLSCIKHGETCWSNITKNGIQCCDPTDTCLPNVAWVSLDNNWPGKCGAPSAATQLTNCSGSSCDTAFGPISTNAEGVAKALFGVVLGISGGIAILLIILSGYRLMVSRGNPEQVQQAREQFTAAIVGLMFIIFSLVILQSIGFDILQLPGFRP